MKKHKLARAEAATSTGEPVSAELAKPLPAQGERTNPLLQSSQREKGSRRRQSKPVGRAGSKEGFSEKVTKWLENKAGKPKRAVNGATGKSGPFRLGLRKSSPKRKIIESYYEERSR